MSSFGNVFNEDLVVPEYSSLTAYGDPFVLHSHSSSGQYLSLSSNFGSQSVEDLGLLQLDVSLPSLQLPTNYEKICLE